MDPMDFIRGHPPFDRLSRGQLERVQGAIETVYVPKGTRVLERHGAPSGHLFMIRKGSVLLSRDGQSLQLLEAGDLFGFPSMLGRTSPTADAVAEEDTLLYRIPEEVFRVLMENPSFSEFFALGLAGRLRRTAALEPGPLAGNMTTPAGALVGGPAVFVGPDATVGEAARVMSESRVSSVLVRSAPAGILTDRDLRGRVLARGLGPETKVREVMSAPMKSLHAGASIFEALLYMLENRIHHLPLEREGRIEGVITDTDLLRHQIKTPLYLIARFEKAGAQADLSQYAAEVAGMVETLLSGGLDVSQLGRIVSSLNDALVARLIRQAGAELGDAPCAFAWIVFGSEGRMEQTILTDQDNALVYADNTPEAGAWFARLAEYVVGRLVEAGFPHCKGGFMATNWHRPLDEWVRIFRGWTDTPTPQNLVEAANFFDFRTVHGALDLHPIEKVLHESGDRQVFLAQLVRATTELRPPLGFFRQIVEEEGGVDLKAGGILPLVSLARAWALEARLQARSTLERLELAARAGVLARETAETLTEAFHFLMRLRLREQLRGLRERGTASGRAPLESLTPLERRHLKESFLAIREAQMAAALRFQVSRLG